MSTFPERLIEIRKQYNLTQKQIADGINVKESQYQKYEYGYNKPRYDVIIKLCSYFNVSSDYLLGLSDDHKPVKDLDENS